jgi:hypothetical protein
MFDDDIPDFLHIYAHIAVNQYITKRGNLPPGYVGRFFKRFIRNLFYRLPDNLEVTNYRILYQSRF